MNGRKKHVFSTIFVLCFFSFSFGVFANKYFRKFKQNHQAVVMALLTGKKAEKPLNEKVFLEKIQNRIKTEKTDELSNFILDFPYGDYKVFESGLKYKYHVDVNKANDLIKKDIIRGVVTGDHNLKLIQSYLKEGTTVLDIGAHIGTITIPMAKWAGDKGKVIAFEPQPKIIRELVLNTILNDCNNIEIYWAAVGDKNDQIELAPLVEGNEGGSFLGQGGTNQFVPLKTIDSLNLKNVSLIKIDVEGMENAVLDGAKETILQNKPVIIVEIMGNYNITTAPKDIKEKIFTTISKLENLGYSVVRISDPDYLALPK